MIEIRSLCKSYGKTPVLQDVNLNIPQGSVFGMVTRDLVRENPPC